MNALDKLLRKIAEKYVFDSWYFVCFTTYFVCVILQFILYFMFGRNISAFLTICLYILSLYFQYIFVKNYQKVCLLRLKHNYRNKYLFTQHITKFNMIITVSISFLIGIKPALFSYICYPTTNDIASFLIDVFLTWLGSSASIERIFLEHIEKLWTRKEEKDNSAKETK